MNNGVLNAYVEELRRLPFVTSVRVAGRKGAASSSIELVTAGERYLLKPEILSSHLQKHEAEMWIGRAASWPPDRPHILCAPYVSRPMGERLREGGVHYVDHAGNVFLELGVGKRVDHVALIEGKTLERITPAERAWRAPSNQVLFALLAQPRLLTTTVRSLATAAGVSTMPVLQVRERLLRQGLVSERGKKLQWVPQGLDLARQIWLAGYQSTLRPALIIGSFRPGKPLPIPALEAALSTQLAGLDWRWGGAAAAFRLDPYYRGDRTVIHVHAPELTERDLAARLRMIPDSQGPVVLLKRPGPLAFESATEGTVHPLLSWVELLDEGHDRASEAAARIADKLLRPTDAA